MKKTKKLHLSRETIRKLGDTEIGVAVGGRINLSQFGTCHGGSLGNSACEACATEVDCVTGNGCLTFEGCVKG